MSDGDNAEQPPEPTFLESEIALERIQALTSTARTTWLVLIGFLSFIGLTLLSVRDADFFSLTASTDLPIVNVAIPTTTFFWTAALLAAILHTYFHVLLLKLWDALAEAPPEIGKLKLGDRMFPWLVNDWALRHHANRPVTKRPMDFLADCVTFLLVWLATPIVLAGFWWRSMPAHDARLSLAILAALWVSLFATQCGISRATFRLERPGLGDWKAREGSLGRKGQLRRYVNDLIFPFAWGGLLASLPLSAVVTVAGAGGHHLPAIFAETLGRPWPNVPFVRADLSDAEIAVKPADWRDHEIARQRYHDAWCRDAGIPAHACETPHFPDQVIARQLWCDEFSIEDCTDRFGKIDAAFELDWSIERKAYIDNIRGPDLRGRDLRNVQALGAFLVGIDLRGARLEGATLVYARLEGVDLTFAQLEGAFLAGARLEGAKLHGAKLEGADLKRALLKKVDFRRAQLAGANLTEAQLQLSEWGGRSWLAATIGPSLAHSANFADGVGLEQEHLENVIGDNSTILPRDEGGNQLHVWSCWTEEAAEQYLLAQYNNDQLRDQAHEVFQTLDWICSSGNQPQPVGRPAAAAAIERD